MSAFLAIYRRELAAYFRTPIGWVALTVFLLAHGLCGFSLGRFLQNEEADLAIIFAFHPWLYLFFLPAVAMRLFAEERMRGTLELLMSLPARLSDIVLGKFLAAWSFAALALALTFPAWLTAAYLGNPDHGVILANYLASLLMAGAYLAIAQTVSTLTQNQIIAFVLGVLLCFLFSIGGQDAFHAIVSSLAGAEIAALVASTSFLTHFDGIIKGLVRLPDILFFVSHIVFWLIACWLCADLVRRAP